MIDDCWLFAGALNSYGYGCIWADGKVLKAHRVMYESEVGEIPDGLTLDHLCRVRHCINPKHLEPVTHVMNVMRGESLIAQNARKTHCLNGHPFDEQNTAYTKRGRRECKKCRDIRWRQFRQRQAELKSKV